MLAKRCSPLPHHVRVVFELPACLWADQIFVVGDFNGWNLCGTPMHQERDGHWCAVVDLPYGCRCEFRYFVDGRWLTDGQADGLTTTADGTENSLVVACLPAEGGECEGEQGPGWSEPTSAVPLPSAPGSTPIAQETRRKQLAVRSLTLTLWQTLQRKGRDNGGRHGRYEGCAWPYD